MSSHKTLIIAVVSIWTVIGAYYILRETPVDPHAGHKHSENRMTAKLSAGVNVSFEMTNEEPHVGETLEVIATVEAISGSGEYEYQFFMPKHTELLEPEKSGVIHLEEAQPQKLRILFSQSVDYDMKVHLELRKPGSPNASMFTFSTLKFQENQRQVEELQQRKAEYDE